MWRYTVEYSLPRISIYYVLLKLVKTRGKDSHPYKTVNSMCLCLHRVPQKSPDPRYVVVFGSSERQYVQWVRKRSHIVLTLRLLMSYIYGAPSKARNANVVYIWTYVWQR